MIDDPLSRIIDSALRLHEARFHRKGVPAIVKAVDPVNKLADVYLKGEQVLFDDVPYDPELALAVGDPVLVQIQGGRSYFISSKVKPVGGAIPSAGYGALIESKVLTADAALLDFQNIPAIYQHLRLMILTRSSAAVTGTEIDVYFNNDTSAVYDYVYTIFAEGGTPTTPLITVVDTHGAGAMELGTCAGANAPADAADMTIIEIAGYAQTTFEKAALSFTQQKRGESAGNTVVGTRAGWWRKTDKINRVTVQLGSGEFKAGTIGMLLGIGMR